MLPASASGAAYRVNEPKPRRVYQVWQGNETFFCWGFFVAGPNWRSCLGTGFLLLAPTGIFLGYVAPNVTRKLNAAIMVFSVLLPVLCAVFLFLTACRDPGIIPRKEPDEEYLAGRKPRTQEVVVNGHRVVIRYNDTCHFYQPPRAHHCSVNDNCIERFDHHCPWVGTTIGARNYRTFLLFVLTATVLCLYVIGVCLAQLFLKHEQLVDDARAAGEPTSGLWGRTLRSVIPALVIMGYTFIFAWFVGGLSGFHCYLVATNQTTYENFRYNHDSRPNPFDRGILSNCAEIWCTPTPPSQIDFRAFVDPRKSHAAHDGGELELAAPGQEESMVGTPTGLSSLPQDTTYQPSESSSYDATGSWRGTGPPSWQPARDVSAPASVGVPVGLPALPPQQVPGGSVVSGPSSQGLPHIYTAVHSNGVAALAGGVGEGDEELHGPHWGALTRQPRGGRG